MNLMQKLRPRRAEAALYLAVFFLMLLFSALTPMLADDYSYCFSWVDDSRIRSLGQIVSSMALHRQLTNGRVFTHGLVQLLLMFPRGIFALLNAGAAVLLLSLFRSFLGELKPGRRALLLLTGALLLWDLTPVFGQVFLWLDGAVNYGWGLCLLLLFLRPYALLWLRGEDARPLWRKLLFLAGPRHPGACQRRSGFLRPGRQSPDGAASEQGCDAAAVPALRRDAGSGSEP